jgi:hypothetical protein
MTGPVKTLVAVDSDVDLESLQAALPTDHDVQIVGVVEGLEEGWKTCRRRRQICS